MRILVVSAHPDDEVIGAGGTLARHVAQGDEVYWCVVTEGYNPPWPDDTLAEARQQIYAVQRFLGIKQVSLCGFPTVKLNTVPNIELTSALQTVVDDVKADLVYTTPYCDVNLDHRIVCEATIVATRPLPGSTVKRLLSYEIAPTTRFGLEPFAPNVYVDISAFLDKKLEAMACYKTELREFPHPRSLKGLELLARERGLGVGLQAAECFQLIRDIV
ncbi:MAG: PIG-L family deacetylase [Firmicutes bacterium]|nr:PIG-L family deacetylase [Bacillota bacterium]